jgi:hypothetical protein
MSLVTVASFLILNAFLGSGWNNIPALVPVNMDSVVVIEDFDDGEVTLDSFPGEDADPDSFELSSENTYADSPYSLKLYGNTWKVENIDSVIIETGDVWQVSAFIENVAEIQGFGVMADANVLFYAFAGTEQLDTEQWVTVYQGAFDDSVWNIYQLPIADDWMAYFGYLPVAITHLVFLNDNDGGSGVVYFDLIANISDGLPVPPDVEISYAAGKIYRNAEGRRSVDVQFYSTVTDPDSEQHLYFWDFGDDSISTEPNPSHTFLVLDDHAYTVLVEVVDDTDRWGQATCQVVVDSGPTTFPITINFAGDVMLARRYMEPDGIIPTLGVEAIFEPTKPIVGDAADITVVNLECPFTNATVPHPTKRYVFKSPPENMAGIVYAGIDVVSVGNNHILDYLYPGLEETQAVLDSSGILYSGAGIDSYEAYLPVFHSQSGVNIAFLASSDRTGTYLDYQPQPFLNAGYNKPGFALMDPYYVVQQIESVQDHADLVVMEFHAGNEYVQYPRLEGDLSEFDGWYGDEGYDPKFVVPTRQNRELRQLCIDSGADVVICHHPHVIQGLEVYDGKLIAHSLGNYVFDQRFAETFHSFILNAKIDETGFHDYSLVPIFLDDIDYQDFIPFRAEGELGIHVLDYVARRSKELDTYLHVDRQSVAATVYLDTTSMPTNTYSFEDYSPLIDVDDLWISAPISLKRTGNLSAVTMISPSQQWEYRLGRETVWFGNFEDEGCTLWRVNSDYEWYDESERYQGARSVHHELTSANTGNVVTDLDHWWVGPYEHDSTKYMLHGRLKTVDGQEVTIEVKYYATRLSGTSINTEDIGDSISGNTAWTHYYKDLTVPPDPGGAPDSLIYINIRCNSQPPETGEALSWFDNVGIIEWTDWSSLTTPLPITNPNDFYYIQLRTPTETSEAFLTYTETTYGATPIPSMTLDPASFEVTLNPEGISTEPVTIGNYGAARLDFSVAPGADWLTPDAWTGSVEPGADSLITLTFDASGLGEGSYVSHLIIRSNDPDQSLLFLPIELTVTTSPIVHVDVTPSGNSIELSWPAVPGVTAYNIYRGETPFGPWSLIATESSTVFVDDDAVTLFTQAFYYVTAERAEGSARARSRGNSAFGRMR